MLISKFECRALFYFFFFFLLFFFATTAQWYAIYIENENVTNLENGLRETLEDQEVLQLFILSQGRLAISHI